MSDQVCIRYGCFFISIDFHVQVLCESDLHISAAYKKQWRNDQSLTSFESGKRKYLQHFWSDLGFKGTVVNQALAPLHGWPFEITLTFLKVQKQKQYNPGIIFPLLLISTKSNIALKGLDSTL